MELLQEFIKDSDVVASHRANANPSNTMAADVLGFANRPGLRHGSVQIDLRLDVTSTTTEEKFVLRP
jgi:hypothetical protein